jgi:leucyl aminopeptidase
MRFGIIEAAPAGAQVDLLAVFTAEDGADAPGLAALDAAAGGVVSKLCGLGDLQGRAGEVRVLYPTGLGAPRLALVGVGALEALQAEGLRKAVGAAVKVARDRGAARLGFALPASITDAFPGGPRCAARTVLDAAALAAYTFEGYRTPDADDASPNAALPAEVSIVAGAGSVELKGEAERAAAVAAGLATARDLGNLPANDGTPAAIVDRARAMAGDVGLGVEVLEPADMERLGMGALLGVTRGSENPAQLLLLEHAPAAAGGAPVVLVGKGVTFDTGGISIKGSANLEEMKFDMCGAAAVIGAMETVARLGLGVRVVGVTPLVENMPDGRAYRPGDILRCYGGKTVEVISTDAEGRLILIDALAYAARRYAPSAMVDLATLTGACVIALGDKFAGLFARDEGLAVALRAAGEAAGDPLWPMPQDPRFDEQLKSPYADLKNTGGRPGGACTAARFLSRFVPDEIPWAHIDVAGTAWSTETGAYRCEGATGFGVRLLVGWLESLARA